VRNLQSQRQHLHQDIDGGQSNSKRRAPARRSAFDDEHRCILEVVPPNGDCTALSPTQALRGTVPLWHTSATGDTSATRSSRRPVDVFAARDCPLSCHPQLALEVTAQTTAETYLRLRLREAPQEACHVPSAEVLRILSHVNFRVTTEFDPRTASRNAPDFTLRFTPEVAFRTTVRTTPGAVPGTVPTVVPGGSVRASSAATKAALRRYLADLGLTRSCVPPRWNRYAVFRARRTASLRPGS
jgi:hypothetical protein